MNTKRNIGIIGANSEASEVFEAILRFDQTPKLPKGHPAIVADTVDYGAEMEVKPPYDAKNRKRLFGKE